MARANKILDRIQNVVEYLLTFPFLLAAVQLPFADPLGTDGFVVRVFGGHIALYIYAAWFTFIGLGLIYAKIAKKRKWHTRFLMLIYLTTIYTSILTFYLAGFGAIIDDFVIGGIAAACWLRWKFRTEYLNPQEFQDEISHLKNDPPPLP